MTQDSNISFLSSVIDGIKDCYGDTLVVYCDGPILNDDRLLKAFAEDVVLIKNMGVNIIVVHGGEDQVDKMYTKLGIKSNYVDKIRVIDKEMIGIMEMVLSGSVNKKIVSKINEAKGRGLGMSGKDSRLIEAKKYRSSKSRINSNVENILDFGFMGETTFINPEVLMNIEEHDLIPVISPIAGGDNGETFYINPLSVTSFIASTLAARKIIILAYSGTQIQDKIIPFPNNPGENNASDEFSGALDIGSSGDNVEFLKYIFDICAYSLDNSVEKIHIVDNEVQHSLLINVFAKKESGITIYSNTN